MSKMTDNLESHDPTILSLTDEQTRQTTKDESSRPLVIESLPSSSENSTILLDDPGCDDLNPNSTSESDPNGKCKKKMKKHKKKKNIGANEEACDKSDVEGEISDSNAQLGYIGMSPFTSSGSVMQNKIKSVYDELVKCHDSNKVTSMQVVKFVEFLSKVEKELLHRCNAARRKYVNTKAASYKPNRSDEVGEQAIKYNTVFKRLQDDGAAFNFIRDQFVQSPGYKKFLEISAGVEKDRKQYEEATISFEALLAKEKSDSFWKKKGKSVESSSSSSNK